MVHFFKMMFNWTEVWALLIPLAVLFFHRHQPSFLKPVIIYLFVALFLNLIGDVIGDFKKYLPSWMQSNNPLYNIHSLVRFACFSAFFLTLRQPYFMGLKKALPLLSLVFVLINFTLFDNFFYTRNINGNLLSVEAYLLLVYCMLYYLGKLREEVNPRLSGPDFLGTTGLCIYVVINFFVFLFYVPLIDQDKEMAKQMWNIHNVAYIILCIFIATAFYASPRLNHRG